MSAAGWFGLATAGLFVGFLGVLIKYAGMVQLVAGYDPDRVADEDGLADFVGTNTLYVAALALGGAALLYADPAVDASWVWIGFTVGTLALTVRMLRGAKRYERNSAA